MCLLAFRPVFMVCCLVMLVGFAWIADNSVVHCHSMYLLLVLVFDLFVVCLVWMCLGSGWDSCFAVDFGYGCGCSVVCLFDCDCLLVYLPSVCVVAFGCGWLLGYCLFACGCVVLLFVWLLFTFVLVCFFAFV